MLADISVMVRWAICGLNDAVGMCLRPSKHSSAWISSEMIHALCQADIGHGLQFFPWERFAQRVVRVAQQRTAAIQRLAQGIKGRGVRAICHRLEVQFNLVQPPMSRCMTQWRVVGRLYHDVLLRPAPSGPC